MARKKRTYKRRASTRRSFKRAPSRRRKSSGVGSVMTMALGAGLYGAGREKVSNAIAPVTSRIPLGEYADEAGMLAASYLLMKGKVPFLNKIKMSRDVGKAGFMIESARIGAGLAAGGLGSMTTSTTSRNGVVYL